MLMTRRLEGKLFQTGAAERKLRLPNVFVFAAATIEVTVVVRAPYCEIK